MSRIKTRLYAVIIALSSAGAAAAQDNISWTFAACAGRYSAEMEHAWLMGTNDSALHESNRATFVSLTRAVMTKDTARRLLSHRIEAKLAQSRLIQTATFQTDERRAAYARRMANIHLRECERHLLRG